MSCWVITKKNCKFFSKFLRAEFPFSFSGLFSVFFFFLEKFRVYCNVIKWIFLLIRNIEASKWYKLRCTRLLCDRDHDRDLFTDLKKKPEIFITGRWISIIQTTIGDKKDVNRDSHIASSPISQSSFFKRVRCLFLASSQRKLRGYIEFL